MIGQFNFSSSSPHARARLQERSSWRSAEDKCASSVLCMRAPFVDHVTALKHGLYTPLTRVLSPQCHEFQETHDFTRFVFNSI